MGNRRFGSKRRSFQQATVNFEASQVAHSPRATSDSINKLLLAALPEAILVTATVAKAATARRKRATKLNLDSALNLLRTDSIETARIIGPLWIAEIIRAIAQNIGGQWNPIRIRRLGFHWNQHRLKQDEP